MFFSPKKSFSSLKAASNSNSSSPRSQDFFGARYIHNRASLSTMFDGTEIQFQDNDSQNAFSSLLKSQMMRSGNLNTTPRIFRYRSPPRSSNKENVSFVPQTQPEELNIKSYRKIPQTPYKVLDAPQLIDDFYLNVLD